MTKIEIPLSRTKILLLLLGSIGFVAIGTLFIISPDTFLTTRMSSEGLIRTIGIISVLFFGATSIIGVKKLFGNSVGLTIDENGITDNTNGSSIGLIKWSDITQIKTEQVASTKFLLIFIGNPDFYLDKVTGFKRKLLEGNKRMYGTPLSITSNTLKYNFADLEKIINDKLTEFRQQMPNR